MHDKSEPAQHSGFVSVPEPGRPSHKLTIEFAFKVNRSSIYDTPTPSPYHVSSSKPYITQSPSSPSRPLFEEASVISKLDLT